MLLNLFRQCLDGTNPELLPISTPTWSLKIVSHLPSDEYKSTRIHTSKNMSMNIGSLGLGIQQTQTNLRKQSMNANTSRISDINSVQYKLLPSQDPVQLSSSFLRRKPVLSIHTRLYKNVTIVTIEVNVAHSRIISGVQSFILREYKCHF